MSENPTKRASAGAPSPMIWVWAMLGALLLSVGVGLAVYFYMVAVAERSVGAMVDQRVEQRMAEQAEAPQGPPPAQVKVAQVARQKAQQRVMVVGRLMEVRRATIASEIEGRVVELLTPAGREVVGGETVIARVDPVWSQLAVEQARADLVATQAKATRSIGEYEKVKSLKDQGSAEAQAVIDAKAQADTDAANVLALKAALHRAEETRKRTDIIAPFDGTVTKKLTEQGQWLDPGSAVVEIVSRGLIDAVIDVPEQYISDIGKGTEVEISIDALGQTMKGKVIAINPDGSNAARTYPVKIRMDDQGGLLRVGMSVTARVPLRAEREYLVVPRDAVQYADNGPQVWMSLVMPGSAPGAMPQGIPMDVDVLFGEGTLFAIKPKPKVQGMNLSAGMDVVVEGAERLFPTRPLIVMNAGGAGEAEETAETGEDQPAEAPEVKTEPEAASVR